MASFLKKIFTRRPKPSRIDSTVSNESNTSVGPPAVVTPIALSEPTAAKQEVAANKVFAFIIGINEYKSEAINNLDGSVLDAQAMKDFLVKKLHVPESHVLSLIDGQATREAIVAGFKNHLIGNPSIAPNGRDAMIVFYAGHGSETPAPKGWISQGGKIENICPHDEQTLLVDGTEVHGIPDRTVGALLRTLAAEKGDNITVIFDSCHSGGITRGVPGMQPRIFRKAAQPPEDLDQDIWGSSPEARNATAAVPTGFAYASTSSHVLLAACRHDELAWESQLATAGARGAFTSNLVRQLNQSEDLSHITYSDLLHSLPPLQNQHPQCEGRHKDRPVFNGVIGAQTLPTTFKVSFVGGEYHVEAGEIHGVVNGTLFAIYENTAILGIEKELGFLAAKSVEALRCTLALPTDFTVPDIAKASISRWNANRNLNVFISNFKNFFPEVIDDVSWVENAKKAHLTISRIPNGAEFEFDRRDDLMSKHCRMLTVHLAKTENISEMFKGISDFHYHLYRSHSGTSAAHHLPEVQVALHSLSQTNRNRPLEEPIYEPDGVENIVFRPNNVHTISVPEDTHGLRNDNKFYGLKLQNNSERKLFPYLLYFDPTDYSVQCWYHPEAENMSAPLEARVGTDPPPQLAVGYGAAGADALAFSLDETVDSDFGFLKLFVSTVYIDLRVVEQISPFSNNRGPKKIKLPPATDLWGAWTYVIKTERKKTRNALKTLLSQGL